MDGCISDDNEQHAHWTGPSQCMLLTGFCLGSGGSKLIVDEGSSACLSARVLSASVPDSPPDQLTFHIETSPLHGFLENTLPAPGSEKSNAGVRVGQCMG